MTRYVSCFWLIFVILPLSARQPVTTIYELQYSPHRELVEYALKITEPEYGPATLVFAEQMTQARVQQVLVHKNGLDMAVFAPDPEREETLLPVYFPLSSGLLGYRVCLIREGQQEKFNHITRLADWLAAELLIGQGAKWPDVEVLRANGITVTTNPIPPLLYDMLRQDRFDCFARGVNEVGYELQQPFTNGLELEKRLLLYYPQPAMLFVSPRQPTLATRLTLGLTRAWYDGFMQQHISQQYGALLNQLRCEQRHILMLHNPLLSEQTRQAMEKYAITPADMFAIPGQNCPKVSTVLPRH